MDSLRNGASWLSQSIYVTLTIFFKKEIQNHASGLALYFFLSAIPLVYFLNTIIAGHLELSKALYFLLQMLHLNFMDVDFSNSSDRYYGIFRVTSWVSIAVLLWSSRGLMRSVHGAFSVIFASPKKRNFVSTNLVALMIIPFSFMALTISVAGDDLRLLYTASNSPVVAASLHLASLLTPILIIWSLCFLCFYFIPPARPRLSHTILTSLACALLIALFQFFTNTVFRVDQYIRIYGSLGAIIFALIWAYIVSLIFLLCTEFLRVSGNIDVIAMERIFLGSADSGRIATRIEHMLFKRSARLFEKYGRFCHKDDVVIRLHDDAPSIFYLYSGKIGKYETLQGGLVRTGEVKERELFGEIDYLLKRPSKASYIAEDECFLFALSPEIFEALLNSNPKLSRQVVDTLCLAFPA